MKWWCPAKKSGVRNNRNVVGQECHCASGRFEEGSEGPGCLREQRMGESGLWAGSRLNSGVNVTLCLWYISGMPSSTEHLVKRKSRFPGQVPVSTSFQCLLPQFPPAAMPFQQGPDPLTFPGSVFSHPIQNCTSLVEERRDPDFFWNFLL